MHDAILAGSAQRILSVALDRPVCSVSLILRKLPATSDRPLSAGVDTAAMTTATEPCLAPRVGIRTVTVEVVVPIYNEVAQLEASIRRLRRYLDDCFPFCSLVTIADNASIDGSWGVASRLAAQLPGVRAIHLSEKGRGRALKAAWAASDADIVAYMDVDLSTDLDAFLPLVAPLISGHSDISIGSRLAPGAHVVRGPKRELISRIYNVAVRAATGSQFSDAQCGFKAVRADVARALLPRVADDSWFFDTELLVLADHNGLRIHEVPVDWIDDPDSSVDIMATAIGDLKGLWRMSRQLAAGRGQAGLSRSGPTDDQALLGRFARIGGLSTIVYLGAFVALHVLIGPLAANAVALTTCALGSFVAHRRGAGLAWHRAVDPYRFVLVSAASFAVGLSLSTVGLVAAGRISSSILVALIALVTANVATSAARFTTIRAVVFRRHLDDHVRGVAEAESR